MKASENFTIFCENLDGKLKKEPPLYICNLKKNDELRDLSKIELSDKYLYIWDKKGKKASLHVPDNLIIQPISINYKIGDWLLDSSGGILEGNFKISRIIGETNVFDDMLKIRLRDD